MQTISVPVSIQACKPGLLSLLFTELRGDCVHVSTLEVSQTTDGVLYHQEIELHDFSDGVEAKRELGSRLTVSCVVPPGPPPLPSAHTSSPPLFFAEPLSVEG